MLSRLVVPFVDARASALSWWLGDDAPPPLATLVLPGTTGAPEAGTAEYADYLPAGGGDRRLSFERYSAGGSWEVSAGRVVLAESLTILHS